MAQYIWTYERDSNVLVQNKRVVIDEEKEANLCSIHKYYLYYYPNNILYNIILSDYNSIALIDLFTALNNSYIDQSIDVKRANLLAAQKLIESLSHSNLPKDVIKNIIEKMCPNFGLFATSFLDTFELRPAARVDLNKIGAMYTEKDDIDRLENNKITAIQNTQVLLLARKANHLSKEGR